jgi:lipid-A-disaccharide synthase
LRRALRIVDRGARTVMVASNVVLLASGTATLEAMLAKRPMVVGYKIAPLTYTLVKRMGMLKVDHYALPNVLAGEVVVPELMQHDCTPENLAGAVLRWLRDPAASAALLPKFQRIHLELKRDASARAADAIAELIAEPRPAA